jgi:gas vesicle protein
MRKALSFLFGAILGGLMGGASILLLAPGSGTDTQKVIRERLLNLRIELNKAIAEKRAALESELQEFKSQR